MKFVNKRKNEIWFLLFLNIHIFKVLRVLD